LYVKNGHWITHPDDDEPKGNKTDDDDHKSKPKAGLKGLYG
jgi:hypothetical protein